MPVKDECVVKYTLADGTNGEINLDFVPHDFIASLEESQEWQRVRHGHWEDSECGWKCSVCGGENELHPTPYCMWCGAKMEQA